MIFDHLSKEFNIEEEKVKNIIDLINKSYTLPFIAHYRKYSTGNLSHNKLIKFKKFYNYLTSLDDRKKEIIADISSKDLLNSDLKQSILEAETNRDLDDLYAPFNEKTESLSSIAKSQGLSPLANIIRFQQTKIPIEEIARDFINEDKGIKTVEDALSGAKNIVAEKVSENIHFRNLIRKITYEEGQLEVFKSESIEEDETGFELYYDIKEPIIDLANHRILAINRGEKEGILKVNIIAPVNEIVEYLIRHTLIDLSNDYSEDYNEITRPYVEEAVEDAYRDIISPTVANELREYLTDRAEDQSIEVFSLNLENLLMQKPIKDKVILGWNPSLYDASRLAVIDGKGKVLKTDNIYIGDIEELNSTVSYLINEYNIELIALGSFTESNKFEEIISKIIEKDEFKKKVKYAVINQAGASDYSQSIFGNLEYPNYDVGDRIAISIAKRLQDPLAELVKVDPKIIGVGQYQHDMDEKKLIESLSDVINIAVNEVGVDVNNASLSLLTHISGLDSAIAKNIHDYKEKNGRLNSREELLKIEGITEEVFKQASGFLKVDNPNNRLDNTKIHPESYGVAKDILEKLDLKLEEIGDKKVSLAELNFKSLANEFNNDEYTVQDIAIQLKNPKSDLRNKNSHVLLKTKPLTIEDLKPGMEMEGIVRNVVDFGAFIDLGVYHDGLIHISKMNHGQFVNHPTEIVNVGDKVKIQVLEVDLSKNRIQLYLLK